MYLLQDSMGWHRPLSFVRRFRCSGLIPKSLGPKRKGKGFLEASKGGMKGGRIKDPLYKDSYFGTTPPTFTPPFEAPEVYGPKTPQRRLKQGMCIKLYEVM